MFIPVLHVLNKVNHVYNKLTRPDSLITEEVCNNSTPSDSTKQCNYKESGCYKETKALNGGNTDSNNDNGKKIMAKIMEKWFGRK